MTTVAFDTETFLITAEEPVPRMVCMSVASMDDDGETEAQVLHVKDPACRRVVEQLLSGKHKLVGQHVAFDMAVLVRQWPDLEQAVFDVYDADLVHDTRIRQKLIDIAKGTAGGYRDMSTGAWVKPAYQLAALAKRYEYPIDLDKDTWRMRYSELIDIPVEQWEQSAVDYSAHDALSTLWVFNAQEKYLGALADQYRQAQAATGLFDVSRNGLRTDRFMVARLRKVIQEEIDSCKQRLIDAGIVYAVAEKDGSITWKRRTKEMQALAMRINPDGPRTEKGAVRLDADSVLKYPHDSIVRAYSTYSSASTAMGHLEELEKGQDVAIHTRFDELKETGRTSSSSPNVQNRAVEPGDRECFVPRQKGWVFIDIDYDGLELRTLAQVCKRLVGYSRLADVLNAGKDPHAIVAAQLLGVSYDEVIRRKENPADKEVYLARQTGKILNFGLGGGLGPDSLVEQARAKYDVIITFERAVDLIAIWLQTWPEMREYFERIRNALSGGSTTVVQLFSNRVRGQCSYTVACNTYFQGLGADATKAALYALVRETRIGKGPLRGCRVVNYVHDQYIVEAPEERAHEAALQLQELVTLVANQWLPDVPTKAKPLLTRRWSKLAKRIEKNGRLIPWEWDEAVKAGSPGYAT